MINELARAYGPGLRAGRRIVVTVVDRRGEMTETELTDTARVMPSDPTKRVAFDFVLDYDDKQLPLRGEAGLIEDWSASRSNIWIGLGYRVIFTTRDCYVSPDGIKFSGKGVAGNVDLGNGWQEYLTTK